MKFGIARLFPIAALALGATISVASADLADKKVITITEARNAITAAVAEAEKNGWKMVICVTDDGGRLIALERMDGAPSSSVDIAQGKARTAALYGRPSGALEEAVKTRPALSTVPFVLLQGALPVMANGIVIGSVGVSGGQSAQDEQVSRAGVIAIKGADQLK